MFADSFCQMLLKLREKRVVEEMQNNTQNNRKEVEDEAVI